MSEANPTHRIIHGDALATLRDFPSAAVDSVITSPPYYRQRRYGPAGEIGWETSVDEYVAAIVHVFAEAYRVAAEHGSLWLVLGDTYQRKRLLGVPWRVAHELDGAGWILRSEIIWWKRGAMPESAEDRPSRDHETVLFFVKDTARYWYDELAARRERSASQRGALASNLRSVWPQPPPRFRGDHFATFPVPLAERMIRLSCPYQVCVECGEPRRRLKSRLSLLRSDLPRTDHNFRPNMYNGAKTRAQVHAGIGQKFTRVRHLGWSSCGHSAFRPGLVLDPFVGSGSTLVAARLRRRSSVGIDLNEEYLRVAEARLATRP